MGAIIGVCAILNVVRSLITTATNFYLLRNTLGNGIHLLGSCFTSVTNYLLRNNYEQDPTTEVEMRSLATSMGDINDNSQNEPSQTYGLAREQLEDIVTGQNE